MHHLHRYIFIEECVDYKKLIINKHGTITWSWAYEDVDQRTELLEAFERADAETEVPPKAKQASLTSRICLWHMTISCWWPPYSPSIRFCCLHERFHVFFPASFSKSPLKSPFSEVSVFWCFYHIHVNEWVKWKQISPFLYENIVV